MTDRLVYVGPWTFSVRKDFIMHPGLTIGAKMLYIAIKSYCGPDSGDSAFPSADTLAAGLRVSRESIYNYAAILEECGLLERTQDHSSKDGEKGQFSHTTYRLYDTANIKPLPPKPPKAKSKKSAEEKSREVKDTSRQESATEKLDTNRTDPPLVEYLPISKEEAPPAPELKKPKPEQVTIPTSLNTPEFQSLWSDWKAHRKALRKPLTLQAERLQLQKLSEWGLPIALRAITHAIEQGWQGIYPADGDKQAVAQLSQSVIAQPSLFATSKPCQVIPLPTIPPANETPAERELRLQRIKEERRLRAARCAC